MNQAIEVSEDRKTFWSIAALAYAPTAAVMFGILWVVVVAIGEPMFATPLFQFDTGALPLFLGIAISFGLAVPVAFGIARAMLTNRGASAMNQPRATSLPYDS
jgi:hypothetical protein